MQTVCCWVYAINKYGYPPSIPDTYKAIEEMAALGFKYIELEGVCIEGIDEDNVRAVYDEKEKLKACCDDNGVEVVNFLPIVPDLVSLDDARRSKAFDQLRMSAEISQCLGCALLSGDSHFAPLEFVTGTPYRETIGSCGEVKVRVDPDFDWNRQWQTLVESMSQSAALAAEHGLKFAIEPRVGEMISNTDAFLRLAAEVNADNFGVIFDAGHLNAQKEVLVLSIEKLARHIFYVHLSDNDATSNEHLNFGKGTIDWPQVFAALRKVGYDGYIGVDIAEKQNTDDEFAKAKAFLEPLVNAQ